MEDEEEELAFVSTRQHFPTKPCSHRRGLPQKLHCCEMLNFFSGVRDKKHAFLSVYGTPHGSVLFAWFC